jgi:excisionase family DNA binding protein
MTEWLTPNEAAAYLKVNRRTLYGLMQSGKLPYYEMPGSARRRIKREDLDGLLKPGTGTTGEDAQSEGEGRRV